VIKRRDSRAEFFLDAVEKVEHVTLVTLGDIAVTSRRPVVTFSIPGIAFRRRVVTLRTVLASVLPAIGVQSDEHDVPDDSPDLNVHDTVFLEYVQDTSLPAWARNILRPLGPFYSSQILLADQELILGVHMGDPAVVSGRAADGYVALCELAGYDGRLVASLRMLQILMPGHCGPPGYWIVAPI
jgi:hypothetical protein